MSAETLAVKSTASSTPEALLLGLLSDEGIVSARRSPQVTRLSGGHSHVTWLVRESGAEGGPVRPRYVVKVAQSDGPLAPYDIAHEVRFTTIARDSGLPSPRVIFSSQDNRLGSPLFVMEFVEGDAPTPREIVPWLREHPETSPVDLARETVRTLLAMGAVTDTPGGVGAGEYYRGYIDSTYDSLLESLAGVCDPSPSLAVAHRELHSAAESLGMTPLSLVQGDFRFGNLLLADGKIAAILDWERGMWGHGLHDLAYLSLPTMRYDGKIAGLVDDEQLEAVWAEEAGSSWNRPALDYLRAVSVFTELCSCTRALCALARGRGRMSLLKILPIIARHETDLLRILTTWRDNDGLAR
ncbi:phosphotransferase family protein [Nocardia sp. NPDC005745]|uniref:phosphotransferase family protein n=1 Tax=Nocardia sp. NPDC005745 TaxID=3157061 RepID=UPI0033DE8197